MKLLEPELPSGKGAGREVANDFFGALYAAGIAGGAIIAAAWIYRQARSKIAQSRQVAASTASAAGNGLQALLG